MLTGSIASLGTQYVVTLDAINGFTGDSVAQEQVQASSKEQVLNALGKSHGQNRAQAAQTATAALSLTKSYDTRSQAAMAYALAGVEAQARSLNQELLRERPDDTVQQKLYGPLVQAQIELNHGNAAGAVELLRAADTYTGTDTLMFYTRAAAYLHAGQVQHALQDFERLRNLHSWAPDDPIISLVRLGQARAYAALGDNLEKPRSLPGLLRPLERCRSRHPHPERCQGGVRENAIAQIVC